VCVGATYALLLARIGPYGRKGFRQGRGVLGGERIALSQQGGRLPGLNGQTFTLTETTVLNGAARSNLLGVNGYGGFQLFADDAYSHYHSLQTTLSRRWAAGYFQAAYTFSRSTDATSSGNTAFNTAFNDESTLNGSRGL